LILASSNTWRPWPDWRDASRRALNAKGQKVDVGLVHAAALLHDIGRSKTHDLRHASVGADLLRARGYPESLCLCVERHTGGGIDPDEARHLGLPVKDYTPRSLEEKIVCHTDNLFNGSQRNPCPRNSNGCAPSSCRRRPGRLKRSTGTVRPAGRRPGRVLVTAMTELLDHQHCRVCERAITVGSTTCPEHAAEFEALQKKRKRTVLMFYVGSAVLVIVLAKQLLGRCSGSDDHSLISSWSSMMSSVNMSSRTGSCTPCWRRSRCWSARRRRLPFLTSSIQQSGFSIRWPRASEGAWRARRRLRGAAVEAEPLGVTTFFPLSGSSFRRRQALACGGRCRLLWTVWRPSSWRTWRHRGTSDSASSGRAFKRIWGTVRKRVPIGGATEG